MKSFILLAIIVVTGKAADAGILDVSSLQIKVNGEYSNPYADVGLCRDDILSKRVKDFDIDEIANSGNYNILYTTGDYDCGTAEIHGDSTRYNGSATRITKLGKSQPIKATYGLKVVKHGIIEETYYGLDPKGNPLINIYKLVVVFWDERAGVFEYVRCSDKGTSTTDSRSIVVRDCFTKSDSPGIVIANTLYKLDDLFGFKGSLKSLQICPK